MSEAKILSALLDAGYIVLLPFGDGCRYDLAIEVEGGLLKRVQCKTAHINRHQNLCFEGKSSYQVKGQRHYHGQIDFFAVYSPETRKSYLIPIEVCGISDITLKLHDSGTFSGANLWAKDFEITPKPIEFFNT
jgi:hypothetical protein